LKNFAFKTKEIFGVRLNSRCIFVETITIYIRMPKQLIPTIQWITSLCDQRIRTTYPL